MQDYIHIIVAACAATITIINRNKRRAEGPSWLLRNALCRRFSCNLLEEGPRALPLIINLNLQILIYASTKEGPKALLSYLLLLLQNQQGRAKGPSLLPNDAGGKS